MVSFLYITNFLLGFSRVNWGVLLATNPKLPGKFHCDTSALIRYRTELSLCGVNLRGHVGNMCQQVL